MKFDFGDLYKFIVSAGVGLVGISILSAWLILKEPFDLRVKETDLLQLTPVAREIIDYRQKIIGKVVRFSICLFPITAISGLIIAGWGIRRWKQQQSIVDQLAELGLQEKKIAIRPKTEDELAQPDGVQGQELLGLSKADSANSSFTSSLEMQFERKLQSFLPKEYEVNQNMIVSGIAVDFVLNSSHWLHKDYLLELKYIRKGFNYGWLAQVAIQLRTAAVLYSNVTGRNPNTCLVVVVENSVWNAKKYEDLKVRFFNNHPQRSAKNRVVIISEDAFDRLDSVIVSQEMGLPIK